MKINYQFDCLYNFEKYYTLINHLYNWYFIVFLVINAGFDYFTQFYYFFIHTFMFKFVFEFEFV